MDSKTAQQVILTQADLTVTDSFLARLQRQQPPIPGQVTSMLLALRTLTDDLKATEHLERTLVYALHQLAYESRQLYEQGRRTKVEWPPLLNSDIERVAIAVGQIFKGEP